MRLFVRTQIVNFRHTRYRRSRDLGTPLYALNSVLVTLGVSHVTAIRTLKRLHEEGYVITARHKPVSLTPKGLKTAKFAKERHDIVLQLLIKLGVPQAVAEVDAEGAEHHISPVTLDCIKQFLSPKGASSKAHSFRAVRS